MRVSILIILFTSTLTLVRAQAPVNDSMINAYDLTQMVLDGEGSYCSENDTIGISLFTTNSATPDGVRPSCQPSNHPLTENTWFKYKVGPSKAFDIHFKFQGVTGRLTYPYVTLWKDSDTTDSILTLEEIKCKQYIEPNNDIYSGGGGLEEGQYYYVSIDAATANQSGNFYICASDQAYPDEPDGAYDLTQMVLDGEGSYCSENDTIGISLFSTNTATPDGVRPSCQPSNHPLTENIWFKYKVGSTKAFNLEFKITGITGGLRYPYVTLWEDNDTTDNIITLEEIKCKKYIVSDNDIQIGASDLVENQFYYVSIDAANTGHSGNFHICASDKVYPDEPDIAYDLTQKVLDGEGSYCSENDTIGISLFSTNTATPDGVRPSCQPSSHPLTENIWFKYKVGPTRAFDLKFILQGVSGAIQYPYVTFWMDSDTTDSVLTLEEVKCKKYITQTNNIHGGGGDLEEGRYYYVSIDGATASHSGKFYICASDQAYPDEPDGAYDLTQKLANGDFCSQDESLLFNLKEATDGFSNLTCFNSSYAKVENWFKYQALGFGTIDFKIRSGGSLGNLTYPYISVWELSDQLIEVDCKKYTTSQGDLILSDIEVEQGAWYYFRVDAREVHSGTYSVCLETDVIYNPFISRYPDVCFSIGEIICDKLFYDEVESETLVRIPLNFDGEIPAGFEFCLYTDNELDILGDPILNTEAEYNFTFSNEDNTNALCITFEEDIPEETELELSYKVNLSEINVNSAIHLKPFSISPPCNIECDDCLLNEEKLVQRKLDFEINPIIVLDENNQPQSIQYSDGQVTYQISETFGTEELETLIVKIENDDDEMISYYPFENSIIEDFTHIFNSTGSPSKSEYLIEITAQAKSGLNYYLKAKVLLLNIVFEHFLVKDILINNTTNDNFCGIDSEWLSAWSVNPTDYGDYTIDLSLYDTHFDKNNLTIQGGGTSGYGTYATNVYIPPQIGHFVITAKAENENLGEILEMRYDYIIECANATSPP
jgi:hypothetical protein